MELGLREVSGISWVHPHAAPYLYIDVSALGRAELIADRLLAEHGGSRRSRGEHFKAAITFGSRSAARANG
jgi:hypothetical protein